MRRSLKPAKRYNRPNKNAVYSVAIIGCGEFGALSDIDSNDNKTARSHLKAYHLVKGFNVVACVDHDAAKLKKIKNRYRKIRTYLSYKAMFKEMTPEIVSIVTPDRTHSKILLDILEHPVKLVFCEKPLGFSQKDVSWINRLYEKKKIPIQVNYSRRFIKEFDRLKDQISNNDFGRIKKVVVNYNKGLFHNASHYVDFLLYLIGKPWRVKGISHIKGYDKYDNTVNGILTYRYPHRFDVILIGHDVYPVPFSEIEFFFEKGRIRLINGGSIIEYYVFKADRNSKGGGQLYLTKSIRTEHPDKKIINAIKNIRDYLVSGVPLKSSAAGSLETIKICEKLAGQLRKEGVYA